MTDDLTRDERMAIAVAYLSSAGYFRRRWWFVWKCIGDQADSVFQAALVEAALTYDPARGEWWRHCRRVVNNRLTSAWRGDAARRAREERTARRRGMTGRVYDPEPDEGDAAALLRDSLGVLTDRQREVVRRIFLEGESVRSIAADFGTTRQNVHYHRDCALAKLAEDPRLRRLDPCA